MPLEPYQNTNNIAKHNQRMAGIQSRRNAARTKPGMAMPQTSHLVANAMPPGGPMRTTLPAAPQAQNQTLFLKKPAQGMPRSWSIDAYKSRQSGGFSNAENEVPWNMPADGSTTPPVDPNEAMEKAYQVIRHQPQAATQAQLMASPQHMPGPRSAKPREWSQDAYDRRHSRGSGFSLAESEVPWNLPPGGHQQAAPQQPQPTPSAAPPSTDAVQGAGKQDMARRAIAWMASNPGADFNQEQMQALMQSGFSADEISALKRTHQEEARARQQPARESAAQWAMRDMTMSPDGAMTPDQENALRDAGYDDESIAAIARSEQTSRNLGRTGAVDNRDVLRNQQEQLDAMNEPYPIAGTTSSKYGVSGRRHGGVYSSLSSNDAGFYQDMLARDKAREEALIAQGHADRAAYNSRVAERNQGLKESGLKDPQAAIDNSNRAVSLYNVYRKGGGTAKFEDFASQLYYDGKLSDEGAQYLRGNGYSISKTGQKAPEPGQPLADTARQELDIYGPIEAARAEKRAQIEQRQTSQAEGLARRQADAAAEADIRAKVARDVAAGANPAYARNMYETQARQDKVLNDRRAYEMQQAQLDRDAKLEEARIENAQTPAEKAQQVAYLESINPVMSAHQSGVAAADKLKADMEARGETPSREQLQSAYEQGALLGAPASISAYNMTAEGIPGSSSYDIGRLKSELPGYDPIYVKPDETMGGAQGYGGALGSLGFSEGSSPEVGDKVASGMKEKGEDITPEGILKNVARTTGRNIKNATPSTMVAVIKDKGGVITPNDMRIILAKQGMKLDGQSAIKMAKDSMIFYNQYQYRPVISWLDEHGKSLPGWSQDEWDNLKKTQSSGRFWE